LHVTRLRLSGFKSFVDPTELSIEPGLTGVVGPNGCGKSNLLEALRWVMGATSAKAMRGEGMEDVIFAGTAGRPPRNHAEVTLTLDNADREGPAAFAAEPVLEVSRRIERGAGSTYRINGAEVRAREVQLLFADASTGANSPALVRQGQISELIAARPQNRRLILEEAAGVAGLHGRRHEAQLRLRAAEANLARLDDVAREVDGQQVRLRREARAAARYKTLAARIREAEAALLLARWSAAADGEARANAEAARAIGVTLAAASAAAAASRRLIDADAALPPLRDAAAVAGAVLGRLTLESDRAERELLAARAEAERLEAEIERLGETRERETVIAEDANAALARLEAEIAAMHRDIAEAPERGPALAEAAQAAEAVHAAAQAEAERLSTALAVRQTEARAEVERRREAQARAQRAGDALEAILAEQARLPAEDAPGLLAARQGLTDALAAETQARQALDAAERAHAAAAATEALSRQAMREADDNLARLESGARGLADIADAPGPAGSTLEQVVPAAGLEAALAAALGEDLSVGLDAAAPAFWAGRSASPPLWPEGVSAFAPQVKAPAALAARLAYVGLVAREDGARLAPLCPPGVRLVSRQGDLWRWDGLTVRAEAPRPAQVRLEQRSRLVALQREIAALAPRVAEARGAHAQALAALAAAERDSQGARTQPARAAAAVLAAREALQRLETDEARRAARAAALGDTLSRLQDEAAQARADLEALGPDPGPPGEDPDMAAALAAARASAATAREAAFAARSAVEREAAARAARRRRLEGAQGEAAGWRDRAAAATQRLEGLQADLDRMRGQLASVRDAPAKLEMRGLDLADQTAAAGRRQAEAADALAAAEAARGEAEKAARAADAAAADAREVRAGAEARLEAATAQLAQARAELVAATGQEPQAVARDQAAAAAALPAEPGALESLLDGLERELAALGPVNLRAEDDCAELEARLAELGAERDELAGALRRLGEAIDELNAEGRERLMAAFDVIDRHFRELFTTLFQGGSAELRLVESDDPLESGLEILASPPGKRMAVMSLMSGGEQALTAAALIFAVFLANPAPICILDEIDAPLDDANVERLCNLLDEMRRRAATRFVAITHNPLTMSRMDRLYGVTMVERGVSRLVSVDLRQVESFAASATT
jgi:chromosome segregation protein